MESLIRLTAQKVVQRITQRTLLAELADFERQTVRESFDQLATLNLTDPDQMMFDLTTQYHYLCEALHSQPLNNDSVALIQLHVIMTQMAIAKADTTALLIALSKMCHQLELNPSAPNPGDVPVLKKAIHA